MSFSVTPKKLLIIKSNPNGCLAVEPFLRNRDWSIKSTSDLKEALNYLVQEKPIFIMVSINHPDAKVHKLSSIVSQALNACIIAFTEENTASSRSHLLNYKAEYRLYPPITGPAIERTAHKFFKDLQLKKSPLNSPAEDETSPSTDMVNNIFQHLKNENEFDQTEATVIKKEGPHWIPQEKDSHRKRTTPLELEKNPRSIKKDTIVYRGTKEVLDRFCKTSLDFDNSEPLENSSNLSCIVLECSGGSGYLVAAMGKDRSIDETFMKQIKENLYYFIWENGETVHDHDLLNLKIKSVPFEKWSLLQAEFVRKSIHGYYEIAMAFFPRKDVNLKLNPSKTNDLFSVQIEEIKTDVELDFNLYIYLRQNDKYLLYTPRGVALRAEQKERLIMQGMTHLHILNFEIKDFNKYRAQIYLNEKIKIFDQMENNDNIL